MNRLTARNTSQLALALAGALTTSTLATNASAVPTLVYHQDFQGTPITDDWAATSSCNTHAIGNPAPVPATLGNPAGAECSGTFARETKLWSGGRISTRKSIPVADGDRYCVNTWIRANAAGGTRARPFVGLNFSKSADGFPLNQGSIQGCRNGEHYLIGDAGFSDERQPYQLPAACGTADHCCYVAGPPAYSRSTTGYGAVTPVAAVDGWRYYSKEFTVHSTDVADGNNFMILKLLNYSGLGCESPTTPGAAPGADFDDLRVYKLAAGDVCPDAAAAQADGDDTHSECAGATAFCTSEPKEIQVSGAARNITQNKCVGCTTDFDDVGDFVCGSATPSCDNGTCKACTGDNGTAVATDCGGAKPYCNADGTCGKCAADADCNPVAGITRGGAVCNIASGQCTNNCVVSATGGSDVCADTSFCSGVGPAAEPGVCTTKLANGELIPSRTEDPETVRALCKNVGDAAPRITATIFCASGVCDAGDNRCGQVDGTNCSQANGSTTCRAGVCDVDGKCGLLEGAACDPAGTQKCRGGVACIDNLCGGPPKECTTDGECGSVNFVCNAEFKCQAGCRAGVACPSGKVCDSTTDTIGACVDAPSTSSSSGGSSSSSSGGSSSSSGEPTTSSSSSSSGSSSGGETPVDDGAEEEGGGCSTSTTGGNAASFTPMLIGLGVVFGALRRRRVNARG